MMAAPDELVNHYVDVTDHLDRKLAALKAHESQTAHMDLETAAALRGWARRRSQAGYEPGRLAEAYHVIDTQG